MRNPIDNIPSLGHLAMLNSHSLTPDEDYSKDEPEWWNMWVRHVTWEMKTFFKVLSEQALNTIPTYAIRFEDLREEPERVLSELLAFMLDVKSIEGTVVQERIRQQLAKGSEKQSIYGLKTKSKGFNRNRPMYNDEQIKHMKDELADVMYFFGYAQDEGAAVNPHGYFDFTEAD